MKETKLDKIIDTFFRGFGKVMDFLGKGLSNIIFQVLFYSYFFISLLICSWQLYQTDNIAELSWKSQIVKDFFINLFATVAYGLTYFNQLRRISDIDFKILKFSQKFYSEETTKLCFEPLIADWKIEYSTAVAQNQTWQARWISIRYGYAFISAMFMQSKIGRLLQIIFKS